MLDSCPLCAGSNVEPLHPGYAICADCGLAYLLPEHRLAKDVEFAHYRTHQNDPHDQRYRQFLDRLAQPLRRRVPAPAHGLDYGSGPGPTLSVMLEERGYTMSIYDPFFAPNACVLERKYDFVTCSETVEHFHKPAREFESFNELLRRGGWLGVMTQMFDIEDQSFRFSDWWYRRDPTHVCFYQRRTMRWIARRFGWTVNFEDHGVILFQRQATAERRSHSRDARL